MPESVEMPDEFAGEDYSLRQGEEYVWVYAPDGGLIEKFSLWGPYPLEPAVAASCRAHRDRTGRHYWRP